MTKIHHKKLAVTSSLKGAIIGFAIFIFAGISTGGGHNFVLFYLLASPASALVFMLREYGFEDFLNDASIEGFFILLI